MKLIRREITIRRASKRLLENNASLNNKRIQKLTGEIFELQRSMLTKAQANGTLVTA